MKKYKLNVSLFILVSIILLTSSLLVNAQSFNENVFLANIKNIFLNEKNLLPQCQQLDGSSIVCDSTHPYRLANGACNNLRRKWYGRSDTHYQRFAPAEYDDGISAPRQLSADGRSNLPNARTLASNILPPNPQLSPLSQAFSFFGQFVAHDLVRSAFGIRECLCSTNDPLCFNIPIPSSEISSEFTSQRCIPMRRFLNSKSATFCNTGHREQFNIRTHWLDSDNIYGVSDDEVNNIRLGSKGLLKTSKLPNTAFPGLPISDISQCQKSISINNFGCFFSGDDRVESNVFLTSIHTLFHREHNRIANTLSDLNPSWNDEIVFQETRRIVNAIYQHIIYKEYLPRLIGPALMEIYNLTPLSDGYLGHYDPKLFPQIFNEFGVAAFRLHQLVHNFVQKADQNLRGTNVFRLQSAQWNATDTFFNVDANLRGTLLETTYPLDLQMAESLNEHLNENLVKPVDNFSGKPQSLGAINIQRGRDNGIPSYNTYRNLCGLGTARSFDDLTNIPPKNLARLKANYRDVNDIDLYIGGAAETAITGGNVGQTFACIIAKQFNHLKFADRFFYENGESSSTRFTIEQLKEIRKHTLSKIYCDNLGLLVIKTDSFERIRTRLDTAQHISLNNLILCKNIPGANLTLWSEQLSLKKSG